MKKIFAFLFLFCIHGLLFADAATQALPQKQGANVAEDVAAYGPPVHGDRFVMGTVGEPSNLIPYLTADSASQEIAQYLFVAPLRLDKDLNTECWAAESWSMEDEGRLLRFTLRKGILWEDGVELTAHDVAFTYKLAIDPKVASPYAEDYLRVKEFKVTGRYSFEVRYEKFFARAPFSWMNAILPRHILQGQDIRTSGFARKPIGAGPYRLKSWQVGSRIVLEASPTYFEGRPHIDAVIYRVIADTSTQFMELKAGRLDMMTLSPLQYLRQTTGPRWDEEFRKYKYLASMYLFMGFNLEHPFFKDVRVRRGISHAINRDELVKGVMLGQGGAAFGPYQPGLWPYHPDLKPVQQDKAAAVRLLAEAGFRDTDADGILDKDGLPLAFTILVNQGAEDRLNVATVIQAQLRAVGVDVHIRTVEWAAFVREFVNKGRFDAVILGWTITLDPDIFQVWHSSQAFEGGLNFIHYKNPRVDALLEEASSTPDRAKRTALYYEVQEILHAEQPYCFLYVPYSLPLVHSRFKGIRPTVAGIRYNFNEWWVPEKLQRYRLVP